MPALISHSTPAGPAVLRLRSRYTRRKNLERGEVRHDQMCFRSFRRANKLAGLAAMMTFPAGTVIEVRRIDASELSCRYLVRAQGNAALPVGRVGSTICSGQTLTTARTERGSWCREKPLAKIPDRSRIVDR